MGKHDGRRGQDNRRRENYSSFLYAISRHHSTSRLCPRLSAWALFGILMDDYEHGRNVTPLHPALSEFNWHTLYPSGRMAIDG
ncbi:hypothetical protein BDR03DRAFT_967124 [Suillus americanus]|nr:hypothetical protein BDR03DRAFT_967124 [Suillus americanus]